MFSYRTGNGRVKTLATVGIVTDRTPEILLAHGWVCRGDTWSGLWYDPSTGTGYSISQAEAIRRDRETPRYRFSPPPAYTPRRR